MNEIHRQYHPVASLFPLMDGNDFDALKASAVINGYIVSIFPSIHKEHFYITSVECQTGVYEYLGKPIRHEYITQAFKAMGIDTEAGEWHTEKCQPLAEPPYTKAHPSKRPEPLVYFIEGAGKIKIGVAEYPDSRLDTLQAGSPVPLRILATCAGGHKLENELHKRFAHLRQRGEWFDKSQELLDFIKEIQ